MLFKCSSGGSEEDPSTARRAGPLGSCLVVGVSGGCEVEPSTDRLVVPLGHFVVKVAVGLAEEVLRGVDEEVRFPGETVRESPGLSLN